MLVWTGGLKEGCGITLRPLFHEIPGPTEKYMLLETGNRNTGNVSVSFIFVSQCHLGAIHFQNPLSAINPENVFHINNLSLLSWLLWRKSFFVTSPQGFIRPRNYHKQWEIAKSIYFFPSSPSLRGMIVFCAKICHFLSHFSCDIQLTNWRQFFMRLSCYWSWISS